MGTPTSARMHAYSCAQADGIPSRAASHLFLPGRTIFCGAQMSYISILVLETWTFCKVFVRRGRVLDASAVETDGVAGKSLMQRGPLGSSNCLQGLSGARVLGGFCLGVRAIA